MNPITVSAQLAAFVWFTERRQRARKDPAQAMCFARENWIRFLPLGHEGLGRLLLKIAAGRPSRPFVEAGSKRTRALACRAPVR